MATPAATVDTPPASAEDGLRRLTHLVSAGRVNEARTYVGQLVGRWPESSEIQYMARVLEPPQVLNAGSYMVGKDTAREFDWIKKNAHRYPGCWLAVYDGDLVTSGPDRRRVTEEAQASVGTGRVLLFYEPPADQA